MTLNQFKDLTTEPYSSWWRGEVLITLKNGERFNTMFKKFDGDYIITMNWATKEERRTPCADIAEYGPHSKIH